MRLTLETMERNEGIKRRMNEITAFHDDTKSVTVDSLIYTLEVGAKMFQECLSLDSEDIDIMSWLLATKLACMLVGSGLVIGNGPRNANAPDFGDANLASETRHARYNNYRASSSETLRSFISWQSKGRSQGINFNFIIRSCLEWDEAMFLLLFRPMINHDCISKLRLLHASHYITWSLREPSIASLNDILSLYQEGLITKMKVLSFLSALIEMDGKDTKYWAMLACALGPVGLIHSKKCNVDYCSECERLRKGRFDHKKNRRQKRKHDWWGIDKIKWWDTHFFIFPSTQRIPKKYLPSRKDINTISERIESLCKERPPMCSLLRDNKVKRNLTDVSWMWPVEPSDLDKEDYLDSDSELDGITTKREKLPGEKHTHDMMVEPLSMTLIDTLGSNCSIIVSKILVACHLYGTDHSYVNKAVVYLWNGFLQEDRGKSDSKKFYEALCLLAAQNLNVVSFLNDFTKKGRMKGKHCQLFPFSFTSI